MIEWPLFRKTAIDKVEIRRTSREAVAAGERTLRDEWWLPRAWVYLPAYFALAVALSAACRALAHFLTNSQVEVYLWFALALNCAISFAIECGGERIRRWSYRLRLLVFASLPMLAIVFDRAVLAPLDAESEVNAGVALVVGWATILCVLTVGARYGKKRVPVVAPLVPGLSLFGLLNSLSVDTLIQICFLVFVAAALYLVAYDQVVQRLRRRADEWSTPQPNAAGSAVGNLTGGARGVAMPRALRRLWPTRASISRTAIGYLAACSVWFVAFLVGAALFYYPTEAILPRLFAAPLNALRGASAALLDWRGSSPVMELRGGNYPLSERAVFQIELSNSDASMQSTPILWRGRIYEQYDASRWTEAEDPSDTQLSLARDTLAPLTLPASWRSPRAVFDQAKSGHRQFSPRLVRRYDIQAFVQPERGAPPALVFPGELAALESGWHQIKARANGTLSADGHFGATSYQVRASIKEERLSGLLRAPGLSRADLRAWKQDASLKNSLELTPYLRAQLAPILAQIKMQTRSFDTPYAKANAIGSYLVSTCRYSLSAPLVPATDDAVIFFLTKSKRGACDMFASSMALLLRDCDVPARLATGYIEPEELTGGRVTTGGVSLSSGLSADTQANMQSAGRSEMQAASTGDGAVEIIRNPNEPTPDGNQKKLAFSLREKDAHAWVEYFVPGAGWLTYDPTAGTRTTQMPLDAQIATFLNLPNIQPNWQVLWLPLCGLLLIGMGVAWSLFDASPQTARGPLTPEDAERARIDNAYEAGAKMLRRRVPRASHQTLLEYEAAVHRAEIPHAARQEFTALTFLLMAARYQERPPVLKEDELQNCLNRLRHALK